jgi:hypothetical protein
MIDSDTLKGPLGWSILSIAILLIFFIVGISSVVSPLLDQANDDAQANQVEPILEQFDNYIAMDIARFNGRSAFFKPIRISKPAPPAPPKDTPPPKVPEPIIVEDPGPPPAPSEYMGPTLIAIIGEEAWFRGSGANSVLRIKIGDEADGLKVVGTKAPAIVTVEHRRGVYDVPLFTSEEDFFRDEPLPRTTDDFFEEVEG